VSIETQAPNPLSTLIHMYNDDKSTELSRGTPVRIQEEEGPEKTFSSSPKKVSSVGPKGKDQGIPQKKLKLKVISTQDVIHNFGHRDDVMMML
jgi:hypothetical protein